MNIEKAIEVLISLINVNIKGDDALKLTQAALNLAHTQSILENTKKM